MSDRRPPVRPGTHIGTGMDRQGMIAPVNPFVEADGTLTPVSFRFLWDMFKGVGTGGGSTGPAGPQGSPGAAATVNAGTTATTPPGTSANVVNVGTTSAALFNFFIPRGDVGPPGTPATGTNGDQLFYLSGAWTGQRPRYGVAFSFIGGVLPASQLLGIHCFTKGVTFSVNFGPYLGNAPEAGGTANATASTVIAVDRALAASPNTWTNVGSVSFAAGGITPAFATGGGVEVAFAIGDRMRLVAPAAPDATFANFYASLVARET